MALWRFTRKPAVPADTGQVRKLKKPIKRSPPVPMEVKVLAIGALEAGLTVRELEEYLTANVPIVAARSSRVQNPTVTTGSRDRVLAIPGE